MGRHIPPVQSEIIQFQALETSFLPPAGSHTGLSPEVVEFKTGAGYKPGLCFFSSFFLYNTFETFPIETFQIELRVALCCVKCF